jgi:hypothetical protein
VSTAEAVHFEAWLEGPQAFAAEQGEVGDLYRARLREYYARDPRAAIDLAGRHGYEPEHPTSNAAAKNASEAAYSHYRFERGMDEASHPGDEPMTRADFDTLYRQGLEFDAVTDTWVRQRGAVPATHAGGIPAGGIGGSTHFVGEVPSRTIGAEVMKELTAGNADALRMVGVEPPPGFDPRANEWGLAQLKDGRVVLVRGGAGEVDWSQLPPDLTPLAHTHPFRDPVTGAERLLTGVDTGSGKPYSMDAKALFIDTPFPGPAPDVTVRTDDLLRPGSLLGPVRLDAEIAGAMGNAIFRGTTAIALPKPVLITVGGRQSLER